MNAIYSVICRGGGNHNGYLASSAISQNNKEKEMNAVRSIAVGLLCLAAGVAGAETMKSSLDYVQDGLVAMWDGYENSGRIDHREAATKWVDLVRGVEIDIPGWVTVEETSLLSYSALSNVSIKTNAIEGLSSSDAAWTIEIVQQSCGWRKTDINYDNLQNVFSTPRGTIGYRQNNAKGFYFYGPSSATQCSLQNWSHATAKVADIHTMTAKLGADQSTSAIWMDAVRDTVSYNAGYTANRPTVFSFFGNLRMDIRVYAIRVYNRELTPEEMAANHAVDVTRFVDGNYARDGLYVVGSPEEFGDVEPAYGFLADLPEMGSFTMTAPASWTSDDGKTRASCAGWRLEREDGTVTSGDGNSATFDDAAELKKATLTWCWNVSYKTTASVSGEGGTAEAKQEDVAHGGMARFTATPKPGYAVAWSGDSLEGTMLGNELVLANVQGPVEVVATFFEPSPSAGELKGPYATFAHRTSIVFDGYAGEETLLDFPALVRVSEGSGGFSYAQCVAGGGKDVRFTLADGVELPSEVAVWNPQGESAFWVRLPVLKGRDTRIVMHWGAANPPAREQAGSVWSEDYNGVWAFEDEKRVLRDSTRHGQHGSASFDSDRSEGVVGRARTFVGNFSSTGSSDYALAGHPREDLQFKAPKVTWECWYRRAESTDGKSHVLMCTYRGGYGDCRVAIKDNGLAWLNSQSAVAVASVPPAAPDEWHHVMFTVDGVKAYAYTDGVLTCSRNGFISGSEAWDGWGMKTSPDVGLCFSYLGTLDNFYPYSGQLDEARVSRVCRSKDYALAVYENVAHNDSFLSFESASNMPHLTVTGDEIPLAEGATSPAYGVYPADMSIDVSAVATCEQGGVRWVREGYTLSADGKEIASGDGGAVKVNWPADSTDVVVRWHWRRQYAVTVAGDESCAVEPEGTDWYDAGTTLAVTATVAGTERAFYAWGGNCPTLEVFNASMVLPVDRPRSVTAISGKAFHAEAGKDTLIDVLTNGVAAAGEYPAVVLAGPGTYTFTHAAGTYALTLDKAIALRSTDGSAATVLDFEARANAYGIKTTTKGAYVGGFTLANLYVTADDWNGANKNGLFLNPGHACDCVVDGMKEVGNKSATISTAGGWIRNCKVINTQQGTGTRYDGFCVWVKDTLVESCVFSNNLTRGGGVVYMSNDASGNSTTFRNCLFVGNTAHVGADNGLNGGAIGIATGTIQGKVPLIENCLFVDNTIVETSGRGGAIYYKDSANNVMLQVVNSLFDGNSVPGGEAYGLDAYGSVLFFNCAGSGLIPENGSLAAAPVFRDREGHDFHVSGLSPTRDAGGLVEQALTPGATDFDGTARVKDGRIDIGPYEYEADVEPFGVNVAADVVKGTGSLTVSFTALLAGDTEGVTYEWDFGDGTTSDEAAPVHVYGSGYFNVSLTVRNGADETATFAKEKFVTVIPKVCYVRPDSENPVDPYMTPETAARTLADALVVAADTINVDGTVNIPASLNVLLPLTICGESQETSVLKIGASVVLTLTGRGANLRNLTVQTGSLSWSDAPVVIKAGASVTNCVFTGTEYRAVELQGGSVVDSIIRNYTANRHNYSAGINVTAGGGVIDRCVFTNNVSGRQSYDDVTRSMGVRIDQKYTPATVIRNSLFANNRGVWTGVPTNGSNSTNVCPGAVYTAGNTLIENCTIANNSTYQSTSRRTAGITVVGTGVEIVNTISWGTAVTNKDEQVENVVDLYVLDGVECDVRNCCMSGLESAHGNVAANPKFRKPEKDDFRIKSSSPCYNAGERWDGIETAVDLDGNPRLRWKRPDMGCYECQRGGGMMLLVK